MNKGNIINHSLPALFLLLVIVSATILAPHPASAIETNYQNPVTAAPAIARPSTASCTFILAQNQSFPVPGGNGYDTPFTGSYTPPSSCPGPWSMVVLDFNGNVRGRQFDREAAVWIGNVMVYMGTTPEPTPAGIAWHAERDLSEYTSTLMQPQPYSIQVPNLVNSRFTGVIYVTATLTFYQVGPGFPAASHPDLVTPLSGKWLFLSGRTPVAAPPVLLPTNPTSLYLEMWAKGSSCDEFWYASQPDAYANANGLCGGGAFREVKVLLDGTLVGVVWPFPYVFTGGINPYLWRPIPAVDAFSEPPYMANLTPFIGMLTDGKPHTLSFQVANNGFYWQIDGNLLINQDPSLATTGGKLTTYQVASDADQTVAQTVNTNSALFGFTASRSLTISGTVDTSKGPVTTTIHQDFGFTNNQVLDLINFLENLKGTETITTTTTTVDSQGTTTTIIADSYPIAMTSMFMIPGALASSNADPSTLKFILPATVDQSFIRTASINLNGATAFSNSLSDSVQSEAILVRSLTTGINAVAGGQDSEHYILSDSAGACFNHRITAAQGFVTSDTLIPNC
jgi:hypothetical protein